jgi:hypothetical protein
MFVCFCVMCVCFCLLFEFLCNVCVFLCSVCVFLCTVCVFMCSVCVFLCTVCVFLCSVCVLLCNVCVFLFPVCVSSLYCLCVNVYCITATGCQPSCSKIIIIIIIIIYLKYTVIFCWECLMIFPGVDCGEHSAYTYFPNKSRPVRKMLLSAFHVVGRLVTVNCTVNLVRKVNEHSCFEQMRFCVATETRMHCDQISALHNGS